MEKKSNKIEDVMSSAIEKIKNIIDTNTVVGEAIPTPKGFILPLTKVSVGFVAGGGEYSADKPQIKTINAYPFTGGTGSGVSVQPVGFLCVEEGKIHLIKLDNTTALEKIMETLPKLTEAVANAIKEGKNEKN